MPSSKYQRWLNFRVHGSMEMGIYNLHIKAQVRQNLHKNDQPWSKF